MRALLQAIEDPRLQVDDLVLQAIDVFENLAVSAEELLVLDLLEVGFLRRVLERHPIADRGPISGEKDQWCRVGGLGREGEVEEDERVRVEVEQQVDVADDPDQDDDRLDDDEPPVPRKPVTRSAIRSPTVASSRSFRFTGWRYVSGLGVEVASRIVLGASQWAGLDTAGCSHPRAAVAAQAASSAAEVGQDGEHPPVIVGRRQQLELREDVGDVRLDRLRREEQAVADRLVRAALGHQRQHLALALASGRRAAPRARRRPTSWATTSGSMTEPPRAIRRIASAKSSRSSHAVLEQVADAARAVGDEPHRERRLDVLRQHEDADRRSVLGADRLGRPQALVGVGRRHPDVHDGDVGSMLADGGEQLVGRAGLGDDLEPGLGEQPRDALAQEERVVGEDECAGSRGVAPARGSPRRTARPSG